MKLLVSGATGFIGQHLTRRLIKDGHKVWAIVRPTTNLDPFIAKKIKHYTFDQDINHLMAFMQKERFDGVIHLASLFLAQHKPNDIRGLMDSNILFATSLLEAAAQSQTRWFINTGTFWQHYQDQNYSPVNLYAASKQAFEDMARYYIETATINFVTIKLSDTFGPGDTRPKVFNLWSKIAQTKEQLDMSPGKQIIDISYIENVVDGYTRLIALLASDQKRRLSGQSFAISSGERMTLKELSRRFEQVTGAKLNINWGKREYRPREVMIPWSKGQTIPGWQPRVTLAKGIKETFNEK